MQLKVIIPGRETPVDVHVTLGFAGTEALLKVPGYRRLTFMGTKGHMDLDLFDASMKHWDSQVRREERNAMMSNGGCGGVAGGDIGSPRVPV